MTKIYAVMCARNEEANLLLSLHSLICQTILPEKIIVVDDGSTDRTLDVAKEFDAKVIHLPYHRTSHAGTILMAKKFNCGFSTIPSDADYIMVAGADDSFPHYYCERIINRMADDSKLVVASGQLLNERTVSTLPRGGGRVIKGWFWRQLGSHYPISWGWEDWINYKAMSMGLKTKGFDDIKFLRLRYDRRTWKKAFGDGKAMYALGYAPHYAIGRCVKLLRMSPKQAIATFFGWFVHRGVKKLDISSWVRKTQTSGFKRRVIHYINEGV